MTLKHYRVGIYPRSGGGFGAILDVRATSWATAVKAAIAQLSENTHPPDRAHWNDSVFQVIDTATGRENMLSSLADLDVDRAQRAPTGPQTPAVDVFSSEAALARAETTVGHSNQVYVSGSSALPSSEVERGRPAADVRRTLDNPPRWRRRPVNDTVPQVDAAIRTPRLKSLGRHAKKRSARGEFTAVATGWTEPGKEIREISSAALALAWDHIHCEAMQIVIPLPQPATFVATAALGEMSGAIVGSRLQLPTELHEVYREEREPVSISTEPMRFIWEKREGAIVSLVARTILWMPVMGAEELVCIVMALNPTQADEFADGDLAGAGYLVKTLSQQLAHFASGA